MTVHLSIRHVPDDVRDALAARAARVGQSMQDYLLCTLTEHVARPSVAEAMERVRARKAATRSRVTAASILEAKDEDRA